MICIEICVSVRATEEPSTDETADGIIKGQLKTQSMELLGKNNFKNKIFQVYLFF